MAAYRRVYDSRLTAKNRDQFRNRTLGNRVRAAFNVTRNDPVMPKLRSTDRSTTLQATLIVHLVDGLLSTTAAVI